jgi:DNA (cytosine-5)-methyltransferase 1
MRYLSVCSGIEAATVAWHELGWTPVGYSEIEKFPSESLATRFPDVPNFGDMTLFKEWNLDRDTVDLIVGGTPCQSFSVAGLRKGLDDPRGNLALTFVSMVEYYQPEFFIWENVPGVLSSGGGRDFGSLLTAVGYIGYGWAYRVLDAQYFGVPQRRRRVFLVGHISGDSRRAGEILFESESLRGYPQTSRKSRQKTSSSAEASADAEGGSWPARIAGTLDAHYGDKMGLENQHIDGGATLFVPVSFNPALARTGTLNLTEKTGTILASSHKNGDNQQCVLYNHHPSDGRIIEEPETSGTLTAHMGTGGGNVPLVQHIFRKSTRPRCKDGEETWVDDGIANTLNCFDIGDIQSTNLAVQPIALAENTIGRQPLNGGNGDGFTVGGPMYTLNATGVHGIAHSHAFKVRGGGNGDGSRGGPVGGTGGTGYLGQDEMAFTVAASQDQYVAHDVANTLRANPGSGFRSDGTPVETVVFANVSDCLTSAYGTKWNGNASATNGSLFAMNNWVVRRLMPIECERLQGFPDNWTDIRKDTPDGPRYKAIGNSMAVPVMAWIGKRIQESKERHG